MALSGACHGRFSRVCFRVAPWVVVACTAACTGETLPPQPPPAEVGAAGLSPAHWGARLYQERGCTGCHDLGDGSRSLSGRVTVSVESAEGDDSTPDLHDEAWARDLLLREHHGAPDHPVRLELRPVEAEALAAFLAQSR